MSDQSKATIRFLIGGAAAGSIIGKGGSSITEFQNQSGTKMQASEIVMLSFGHASEGIREFFFSKFSFKRECSSRLVPPSPPQVSRNNEYFPGTQERILTMTGTVNAILTALHLILSKLRAEDIAGTPLRNSLTLLFLSSAPAESFPFTTTRAF